MPQSFTIASGKGGVGKTSIAVNLALMMKKLGHRTTLMDVDFGLANTHILLGLNSQKTLSDVVTRGMPISEAMENAPGGIKVIAGGSGSIDLLHASQTQRLQLIRNTGSIANDTDHLIVDAPAGSDNNTLDFMAASDRVVIVVVAEPTSFMDAYTLLKAAYIERNLRQFSVIINLATSAADAKRHFERFESIALRFLDVKLSYLGHVPYSKLMQRAVIDRKPVLMSAPDTQVSEFLAFKTIAHRLLKAPKNNTHGVHFFEELDHAGERG